MEKTTRRLNTVQSVLSEMAVNHVESILYWFWDEINHDGFTATLMDVLAVYVKHCPDDVHQFRKPDHITRFISELIQLREQIIEVLNDEKPWEWIDNTEGWGLPESRTPQNTTLIGVQPREQPAC